MNIGNRIRKIRKALDLTQTEFAERIGSVQNTVTGYESGRRNPSAPVISLICREFNVDEKWLRTGDGEMFSLSPTSALDTLAQEHHLSHEEYILIEKLLHLKSEVRKGILDYILEVAAALKDSDAQAETPPLDARQPSSTTKAEALHPTHPKAADIDIDAELSAYREELLLHKKAQERSSASDGQNANAV